MRPARITRIRRPLHRKDVSTSSVAGCRRVAYWIAVQSDCPLSGSGLVDQGLGLTGLRNLTRSYRSNTGFPQFFKRVPLCLSLFPGSSTAFSVPAGPVTFECTRNLRRHIPKRCSGSSPLAR